MREDIILICNLSLSYNLLRQLKSLYVKDFQTRCFNPSPTFVSTNGCTRYQKDECDSGDDDGDKDDKGDNGHNGDNGDNGDSGGGDGAATARRRKSGTKVETFKRFSLKIPPRVKKSEKVDQKIVSRYATAILIGQNSVFDADPSS